MIQTIFYIVPITLLMSLCFAVGCRSSQSQHSLVPRVDDSDVQQLVNMTALSPRSIAQVAISRAWRSAEIVAWALESDGSIRSDEYVFSLGNTGNWSLEESRLRYRLRHKELIQSLRQLLDTAGDIRGEDDQERQTVELSRWIVVPATDKAFAAPIHADIFGLQVTAANAYAADNPSDLDDILVDEARSMFMPDPGYILSLLMQIFDMHAEAVARCP